MHIGIEISETPSRKISHLGSVKPISHPDFEGPGGQGTLRLLGTPNALADYEGHGTHVAGIIMGNGGKSTTISNPVPGSIIPGAGFQGKATNAMLYSQSLGLVIGTTIDAAFQEGGAYLSDASLQTNASVQLGPTNLISNIPNYF